MNPWKEDRSDSYVLNFCSNPRKANVTKESELQIWIHIYSQKMVRIFFLDALGEKRKTGWVASTLLKAQFWGDPHWGQNRKDGSTGDEHDQQSIIGAVGVQWCCLLLDAAGGSLKLLRLASWSVRDTGMRNPQVSHAIAGLSPLQRHKGMKKARNTLSYSTRSDEHPHRGHTANPFSKTFRTSWVTPPKKKKNISLLDSIRSLLVFSFLWNNTKQNLHNPIKTFNARSLFLSTHPLFHLVRIRTKHGHLNLQGGKKQTTQEYGIKLSGWTWWPPGSRNSCSVPIQQRLVVHGNTSDDEEGHLWSAQQVFYNWENPTRINHLAQWCASFVSV